MNVRNYLRGAVFIILLVDLFAILSFVRPYLQYAIGPHTHDNLFDSNIYIKSIMVLSVWILAWVVLWCEAVLFSYNKDRYKRSISWWTVGNVIIASIGIMLIISMT